MSTTFQDQIVNLQGLALDYASSTSDNPTINASSGRFTLPANHTSITITNNRVDANSIVDCNCEASAGALVKRCTPSNGSFVMEVNGAGTGSKVFNFTVTNPVATLFTDVTQELVAINGRVHVANHIDCPGPFLTLGNSDREGGVVTTLQIMTSPVVYYIDTTGAVGP